MAVWFANWTFVDEFSIPTALPVFAVSLVVLSSTKRFQFSPHVWNSVFVALLLVQTLLLGVRLGRSQIAEHSMPFGVRHDVQIVNQQGVRALLRGQNPYSQKTPNVMGSDAPWYPPASSTNGFLPFGFLYTPESLLFLLPGEWFAGDFRWMHLLALSGAAWLLFAARPSPLSFGAASAFLWFPANSAVVNLSWTEPMATLFLALSLWCFYRARRWFPWALGLLLSAKQYTVLLLPLVVLLVPLVDERRAVLKKALILVVAIALPFVLWDTADFWRSAVWMQVQQPFRADSLSYLAAISRETGVQISSLAGFVALGTALVLTRRAAPQTPSGFCLAGALCFWAFFAWNKQAFANYYFWTMALALAGVAVALPPSFVDVKTCNRADG